LPIVNAIIAEDKSGNAPVTTPYLVDEQPEQVVAV